MVTVDEDGVSYWLKKGVYYTMCCVSSFGLVVLVKKDSFFGRVGWGILCTLYPIMCLVFLGCVRYF